MGKPLFTPEELAELAAFDAEIDESDITQNEIDASRERDREAVLAGMSKRNRKIAEYKRAYYEANREKIAENKRAYYEANREKIVEYQRAYYEANREKIAENKRAYREANREKIAEYRRAYYEANREKIAEYQRAYYEANREKWNAYQREYKKRRRTHGENQSSKHHHQGAAGCVRGADAPGADDAQADR